MPKKQLTGTITSLAQAKTARVEVERQWQHPLYKKRVKRTKSYACHYEDLELKLDDKVMIEECRPVSKTKKFRVIKKLD